MKDNEEARRGGRLSNFIGNTLDRIGVTELEDDKGDSEQRLPTRAERRRGVEPAPALPSATTPENGTTGGRVGMHLFKPVRYDVDQDSASTVMQISDLIRSGEVALVSYAQIQSVEDRKLITVFLGGVAYASSAICIQDAITESGEQVLYLYCPANYPVQRHDDSSTGSTAFPRRVRSRLASGISEDNGDMPESLRNIG